MFAYLGGQKVASLGEPEAHDSHRQILERDHEVTMRWPGTSADDENQRSRSEPWLDHLRSDDWHTTLTEPRTLVPSLLLTASTIALVRFYKSYLRRIPTVNHIKPGYYRRRSLFGCVTSVGDADNFRFFHTPGGRLAGWGWLPWKKVPTRKEELVNQTV